MSVTKSNLVMGPGRCYVAAFGAVEPTDATTAWDALVWTDLGATQGGIALIVNQEFKELEVDQVIDTPGRRLIKRDTRIKTNLAEATLENLARFLNTPSSAITAASGKKTFLPLDTISAMNPTEIAVGFEGPAPAGFLRRVVLRACLSIGNFEAAAKKDGQIVYPMEWASHFVSESVVPYKIIDGTA